MMPTGLITGSFLHAKYFTCMDSLTVRQTL